MRATYCNVDCYIKIFVVIVRRGSVRANTTRLGTRLGTRSRQPVLKLFKNCSNTCDYFSTGQACDVDPAGELREPDVLEYKNMIALREIIRRPEDFCGKQIFPPRLIKFALSGVWCSSFRKYIHVTGYNYFKPCERDGFEYSILALRET